MLFYFLVFVFFFTNNYDLPKRKFTKILRKLLFSFGGKAFSKRSDGKGMPKVCDASEQPSGI